ncbi:rod shape-determining protein MreD [Acidiferrobacter sp.]|uniref:rod shape-determining protein MreD n=1 Tax=Acidiferrobacter sp. TaxID=1872107 RepID=UPI00262126FB|nr:rod shape-determining protein MreD [Acidiferrobacter sp.]
MDNPLTPSQRLLIVATFVAAMVLAVIPLPASVELLRPDWVALVLVYWCMAIPERIGIASGWVLGLFLDALYGSLLGEQALAKALLAFLVLRFTLRLRMFPRSQQAIAVGALIAISDLTVIVINSFAHGTRFLWSDTAPMIANIIVWPAVFTILREVRRRAKIS